ncbi:MAG: Lrp/AsnC ligand binding domain-containing protein [Thermofilum sp.]|jgi:DNA-binding Lrp family transcriptional regulator|nr:Lrp/AsnC ligand binding domain-containing protein [Thermofilum sp.]
MSSERIKVFVLVNTQVGKEDEVLKALRGLEYVEEAYIIYGEYDVIAKLEVPALELLDKVVTNIRNMPGVTRTSTLIASSR